MFNLKRKKLIVGSAVLLVFLFAGASIGGEPKPGDIITSSNIEQYKDYFPLILHGFIKDGWGIVEPAVIHVGERTSNSMPDSFIEASKNNSGKVTLNPDGSVNGLVTGLPFPNPEEPNKAMKIFWNHFYRWRSDGYNYNDGFWTTSQKKGGPITSQLMTIEVLFYSHRTAVHPKPILPNSSDLFFAFKLNNRTGESKDMITLVWRYNDILKSDDMWAYVPTMRRTIRLMSTERSNPIRATPFTWDDVNGFDGRPQDWRPELMSESKLLVLMNQKTKCIKGTKYENGYEHPVVSGPTDLYELREMYCLDVFPRNARYPEQKKSLWIEKETFNVSYAHIYDRQGDLWKGEIIGIMNFTTAQGKPGWTIGSHSCSDLKSSYWSNTLLNTISADGSMIKNEFEPAALGM